jgi:hypothetical protein
MRKSAKRSFIAVSAAALVASLLAPSGVSPAAADAPPAPIGLVPSAGESYSGNPSMSWDAVPGATKYKVQFDDNSGFASPQSIETVQTTLTWYEPLPTGTNYWRVAANNGVLGPYSSTGEFTIGLNGPTPTGPANGAVLEYPDEPAAFTWTPMPGAKKYEFQHDDAADFIGNLQITSETNGAILVGTPPFDQVHYWRVRADYGGDVKSDWSAPQTYTLTWPDQVGKGRPTLVSPANIPLDPVEVTDIELVWQPVLGASSYWLQVSTSSDFSGTSVFNDDVFSTRYSPPETWLNGSYYWRVRGIDRNNNLGPWSATWVFSRKWPAEGATLPGVPNPPTLASPVNGASMGNPARFDWNPTDRATHYEFWIGFDENWSPNTYDNCFTIQTELLAHFDKLAAGSPGGCDVFFEDGTPKANYWRVRAIDKPKGVLGLWSETRSFTYTPYTGQTADPLTAATQTAPDNCDVGQVCDPLNSTPEMRWNRVPGAASYLVYVATDAQFTTVVRRYLVPASDDPRFVPREELPDNNAGQAYYWHVRPCGFVDGTFCTMDPQGQVDPPRRAFQKRSDPVVTHGPGIVWDAAHPPPVDTIPVVTAMPNFTWQDYLESNGSDLEARRYWVQVSLTPQFNAVIDERSVDQLMYTPYDRTYPEGPVYWRVAADDGSGNVLAWSPIRVMRYESVPPTLLSPTDNASLTSVPQFTWTPIPFAKVYRFELYKNGNDPISEANRIDDRDTQFADFTSHNALPPGVYAWRVRRDDGQDRDGPWSDLFRYTITSYAPLLTAPPNGASYDSNEIVFTWSPIPQASRYRFQISTAADFSSITQARDTVMAAWAPTSSLPDGVTLYWRVQALNSDNAVIGTSNVRTATKETRDLASKPTNFLVTPTPGTLSLKWTAPLASGNPAFTEYRITVEPGGRTYTVPKTTTSYVVNGLTNGVSHTVTVRAKHANGGLGDTASANSSPNGCTGTPFKDVPSTSPFCADIFWMFDNGYTTGTVAADASVYYNPGQPVSRKAMAAFLYRYEGEPGFDPPQFFADVPPSDAFYGSIQWMGQSGLSAGTPNPTGLPLYKPLESMSRQAMAVFLHRYGGDAAPTLVSPFFADVPATNPFYSHIQWMAETGLSTGYNNPPGCIPSVNCGTPLYKPVDAVSRGSMAAFLHRFDDEFGTP